MFNLTMFFNRLLAIPLAPTRIISGIWNEPGRGQYLLLGMPALIVAGIGVAALTFGSFGNPKLEKKYNSLANKNNEEAKTIATELERERRIIVVQRIQESNSKLGIKEDDPRLKELMDHREAEKLYLEKLIALNENDPDYKYRLALVSINEGDYQRGFSLMRSIAPIDEPKYAKAHLYLAEFLINRPVKSQAELKKNRMRALEHVNNCLVSDKNNIRAKELKALLLAYSKQWQLSRQVYRELFEEDPKYYRPLMQINAELGQTVRNDAILTTAIYKFRERATNKDTDDVKAWVEAWRQYATCLRLKQDFEEAETSLKNEIDRQSADVARRKFLEGELSKTYTEWVGRIAGRDATKEQKLQQIELLKKAMQYDSKNQGAMRWLAYLGNAPDVGAEAKKVYDPAVDINAPSAVLSEVGSFALRNDDYEKAIEYFERARKKQPRDPQVLNNLAYVYLVCEDRNPERALLLVDQAIQFISTLGAERMKYISHFYHTRGVALMQMNRMEEAAAAFEVALQTRPDNAEIIERLVECYEGRDERQQEVYRRRLQKIKEQNRNKSGEASIDNSGN